MISGQGRNDVGNLGKMSSEEKQRWQFNLRDLFALVTACGIAVWILRNWLPLVVFLLGIGIILLAIAVLICAVGMVVSIAWQLTFGWRDPGGASVHPEEPNIACHNGGDAMPIWNERKVIVNAEGQSRPTPVV